MMHRVASVRDILRSFARLALIATGWIALLVDSQQAAAHAVYRASVRHDLRLDVSPKNIDISVELTFHEMPSLSERRGMDHNHDLVISAGEREAYLAGLDDMLTEALTLTIDGRGVDLVSLYEPELDLLDESGVAPVHHALRLYYFARTPMWMKAGSTLVVHDALWRETPAIPIAQASGVEGVEVMIEHDGAPHSVAESRFTTVRVRCLNTSSEKPWSPVAESRMPEQAGFAQVAVPTWCRWVPVAAIPVLIISTMIYWRKS